MLNSRRIGNPCSRMSPGIRSTIIAMEVGPLPELRLLRMDEA